MKRRPGFTIVEAVASSAILIATLGLAAQLVTTEARSRRSLDLRLIALQEADAFLEQFAGEPFDAITPESARKAAESVRPSLRLLPEGSIDAEVIAEGADGKRIAVVIGWRGGSEQRQPSVRLVTWAYRHPRRGS